MVQWESFYYIRQITLLIWYLDVYTLSFLKGISICNIFNHSAMIYWKEHLEELNLDLNTEYNLRQLTVGLISKK